MTNSLLPPKFSHDSVWCMALGFLLFFSVVCNRDRLELLVNKQCDLAKVRSASVEQKLEYFQRLSFRKIEMEEDDFIRAMGPPTAVEVFHHDSGDNRLLHWHIGTNSDTHDFLSIEIFPNSHFQLYLIHVLIQDAPTVADCFASTKQ